MLYNDEISVQEYKYDDNFKLIEYLRYYNDIINSVRRWSYNEDGNIIKYIDETIDHRLSREILIRNLRI